MEDLSKFLPLYLGQKVRTYSGRGILSSIDTDGRWYVSLEKGGGTVGNINDKNQPCPEESKKTFPNGYPPKSILTLILRPLSSMTEEEAKVLTGYKEFEHIRQVTGYRTTEKFAEISYRWKDTRMVDGWAYSSNALYFNKKEWTPEQFQKLLEYGMDIFGLKEKGLALYPEDIKE